MQNRASRDICNKEKASEFSTNNKKLERVFDIRKNKIELAIVELDSQLAQVPAIRDPKLLKQVVGHIRDELHALFYFVCGEGLDIREFTRDDDQPTPVSSECC
jgi:hypothetical protein